MPRGETNLVFTDDLRTPEEFAVQPEVYGDELRETRELALALGEAMALIVEHADGNPMRIAVCVARSGSMSYSAIAKRFGISKASVHNHLAAIGANNEHLGHYLRTRPVTKFDECAIRDNLSGGKLMQRYRRKSRAVLSGGASNRRERVQTVFDEIEQLHFERMDRVTDEYRREFEEIRRVHDKRMHELEENDA